MKTPEEVLRDASESAGCRSGQSLLHRIGELRGVSEIAGKTDARDEIYEARKAAGCSPGESLITRCLALNQQEITKG